MNMHSADATTAEEALAIQETIDSDMATEIAMQDTLLTPRFYTTDFDELDAIDVSHIRDEWDPLIDAWSVIQTKDILRKTQTGTKSTGTGWTPS